MTAPDAQQQCWSMLACRWTAHRRFVWRGETDTEGLRSDYRWSTADLPLSIQLTVHLEAASIQEKTSCGCWRPGLTPCSVLPFHRWVGWHALAFAAVMPRFMAYSNNLSRFLMPFCSSPTASVFSWLFLVHFAENFRNDFFVEVFNHDVTRRRHLYNMFLLLKKQVLSALEIFHSTRTNLLFAHTETRLIEWLSLQVRRLVRSAAVDYASAQWFCTSTG